MGFLEAEKNAAMSDVQLQDASNKFGSDGEDVADVVPGSTFTDQQDMRRL